MDIKFSTLDKQALGKSAFILNGILENMKKDEILKIKYDDVSMCLDKDRLEKVTNSLAFLSLDEIFALEKDPSAL